MAACLYVLRPSAPARHSVSSPPHLTSPHLSYTRKRSTGAAPELYQTASHTALPPPTRRKARKPMRTGYVMTTFKNGAAHRNGVGNGLGDGLRLLASPDGRRWQPLPGEPILLRTDATGGRVLRDPSIVKAGGLFHLVFTSDLCVGQKPRFWRCEQLPLEGRPLARFGYATSVDLLAWEDVRLVEVPLRAACSIWAPEITSLPADEGGGFMVMFSATQVKSGKCPVNFKSTAHRSWYVTSSDMRTFSPPRRLLTSVKDSVIDLFPILNFRRGHPTRPPHALLYKSEHNSCEHREWLLGIAPDAKRSECTLVLHVATAWNASGPWAPLESAKGSFFAQGAISRPCAEGAAAVRLASNEWLVLFDGYRNDCPLRAPRPCGTIAGRRVEELGLKAFETEGAKTCSYLPIRKGLGAMVTSDFYHFEDQSSTIQIPDDYKHGTVVMLSGPEVEAFCSTTLAANMSIMCRTQS
ncbi:hypothetical protein AB1Y20_002586 [Prymnesium parvum]|uniref:Uncharacterized protein n=1 Tax=Prymnesium parvum TaxID=97485 RepID=A0AB34JBK2_PRYPA